MMIRQNFNRRHSPNRRKTQVEAVVDVDGVMHPAIITNVSFEGMKLATPIRLEPGSPIMIEVLQQRIPAIVHWCKSPQIGVHLLERLEGQTLIALENASDDLAAFR